LHRLDLVISDTPVPPNVEVKAYSHKLGESGVTFMAHPKLAKQSSQPFPRNLEQLPLLLPERIRQCARPSMNGLINSD